ncbi:DNA-processing protein DprA [Tellurirhabdus bombi]|uniref:DNA-processing protein DprA n=1 Tax=Tellurirhabdus bombi TaxID=2907205 RepID=UPI001F4325C7|nr:DNA-processing protein DprA [Tellurirhabdus bombi]
MNQSESFYQLALTLVAGVGDVLIRHLISYSGSATAVFQSSAGKLMKIPGVGEVTARAILSPEVLKEAERVTQQTEALGVKTVFYTDKCYPSRLKSLYDAPALFYWQGNADLNTGRTLGIVGTRQATDYGRRMTEEIIQALKAYQPLIISGLAYGIDIAAHRASLQHGLPTIGVMASGIDVIYPSVHQKTAQEMRHHGALLTESRPGTKPDAHLFPARNRIIAGLSDVVIVVEAAAKGGALITAEYANNYHRDVFAVPGQVNQSFSQGCNKLIRENKAQIYTRPEDLVEALNWDKPLEMHTNPLLDRALDFTEEESQVIALLRQLTDEHIDDISWKTGLPMGTLAALLLNLEFKGIIRSLPGKRYGLG